MKIYICNALAMGMLNRGEQERGINYRATQGMPRIPSPLTLEEARVFAHSRPFAESSSPELVAAVGHIDTARLIADALGLSIEQVHGRITVRLRPTTGRYDDDEYALIGAYTGPRLPEGCTTLPEEATLEWWII